MTIDRLTGHDGSVAIKVPCRVATTAAITLSGLQTVDGVAVVAGDRVLVKNQASAAENGIYIASSSAWTRAGDWDGARDVVNGTQISITSGTVNSGYFYTAVCTDPATIGTTAVTFSGSSIATSSAAAAAVSAAAALASENAAAASASTATTQAGNALASANAADVSEANALASANAADVSEANALASANAADVSEAAALASQVAAAASAAAAAAIEIAAPTHAATFKTTPADDDEFPLVDSAASWVLKKLRWTNMKTALATACSAGWNALTATNLVGGTNAFSAYLNTPQSLTSGVASTVVFNTENFDTHAKYNVATGIFTPDVAGYYLLSWGVALNAASSSLTGAYSFLYKNGVQYRQASSYTGGAILAFISVGSAVVYFNGTTDNCSVKAYAAGTSPQVTGDAASGYTSFSGCILRP